MNSPVDNHPKSLRVDDRQPESREKLPSRECLTPTTQRLATLVEIT